MMNKRIILAILLLFVLGACSNKPAETPAIEAPVDPATAVPTAAPTDLLLTPSVAPTSPPTAPTADASSVPIAWGPDNFPITVNPLTGQTVSNQALLERRPVAVKVQIFPRGQRPPWGVSLADIVYDYYNNFGLTRFHTIFYGTDAETVGPIRSARLLDQSLVEMYKSIFAFGSAEQRTYSKLFSSNIGERLVVEGDANCPPMCRLDPNGNNYLVTNSNELSNYVTQRGVSNTRQNLNGMTFNEMTPANGQQGQQATIRFSISAYNRWDYDPSSGRYLRAQDVQEANDIQSEAYEPMRDQLTGQQIATDNVAILFAAYDYAFGSRPGPNEVVQVNLMGSGPAVAFRNGQAFELTWNRPGEDYVLYLTFPDGTAYPYKPGNTWYEVVGKSSKISNLGNGAFRFDHSIP